MKLLAVLAHDCPLRRDVVLRDPANPQEMDDEHPKILQISTVGKLILKCCNELERGVS